MDKNIRKIINEISGNKNLDRNLSSFAGYLATAYYNRAIADLTMNYCTYAEELSDDSEVISKVFDYVDELKILVETCLGTEFDGLKREEMISRISSIRDELTSKMNNIVTYTEKLSIYKEVFDKLNYKFNDEYEINYNGNEEATKEIISYIYTNEDNYIINERIKKVISLLPVRMTKTRYYDIIAQSLLRYIFDDKDNFDRFIDRIRTCTMLNSSYSSEEYFIELNNLLDELSGLDYKSITKKVYNALYTKIIKEEVHIIKIATILMQIQNIINSLYVIALTEPYIINNDEEYVNTCKDIIDTINSNISSNIEVLDEKVEKLFIQIEGIQEELQDDLLTIEGTLEDIKERHKGLVDSLMLSPLYNCLFNSQMLLSTSLFVDLNQVSSGEKVNKEYVKEVTSLLINDLKETFDKNSVLVNREIMASSFDYLPLFFESSNEVFDYISNTLFSCSNISEKSLCMERIRQYIDFGDEPIDILR